MASAERMNQSEARMSEVVQGVKKDPSRQMQSTVGDMEKLKQDLAEAVKRVERLDELRSDISKQEGRSSIKGPMLVWGSWRPETRRRDIISDVSNVLKDVAVLDLLGGEIWVPASRHSVALSEFRLREGEGADGQADRVQKVITAVNFARVKSEYTPRRPPYGALYLNLDRSDGKVRAAARQEDSSIYWELGLLRLTVSTQLYRDDVAEG